MITLEQIKNEVCKRHGMQNYTEFIYTCKDIKQLDDIIKEIVYLSQIECLKLASENADIVYKQTESGNFYFGIDEESINNEKNIIK